MRQVALAVLVAGVVAAGVHWGTFVAGGSDSYCYAHQAERWAVGTAAGGRAAGARGAVAGAPAHVRAGRPRAVADGARRRSSRSVRRGCRSSWRRSCGWAAATRCSWWCRCSARCSSAATFAAGARFGARVGLAAARHAACSPVFLYQLVQPMSDVPAAALWMLAVAAATGTDGVRPLVAGLAAGAAILMRPNLAPLGVPIGLFLLFRPERAWRERLARRPGLRGRRRRRLRGGRADPECASTDRPFSSGYGSLDVLFSAEHVGPNASRYLSWLSQAHTPAWLVALAGAVRPAGRAERAVRGDVPREPRVLPAVRRRSTTGGICASCCRRFRSC